MRKDEMRSTCDRCGAGPGVATIMSKFNNDIICMACKTKERAHPEYQKASDAEIRAVRQGDYNFPGIGKPADL
jgi:hypothetical protein